MTTQITHENTIAEFLEGFSKAAEAAQEKADTGEDASLNEYFVELAEEQRENAKEVELILGQLNQALKTTS